MHKTTLSEKLAAMQPHVLVTGHSGAGKSTTASQLSQQLGMPVYSIDSRPEWGDLFRSDPDDEHLVPGTAKRKEFIQLRRRLAQESLAGLTQPTIVEGTQLAGLTNRELADYPNRVVVTTPLKELLRQRLERVRAKALAKGKPWNDEIAAKRQSAGRRIYDDNAKVFRRVSKVPGTVQHNSRSDVQELIAKLQLPKLAAVVSIIRGNPDADPDNATKYENFYSTVADIVRQQGATAKFDSGLSGTVPDGDIWLGHSRGADRLRFAPSSVKTLRLDDFEPVEARASQEADYNRLFKQYGYKTIAEVPIEMRPKPGPEHYTLSPEAKAAIAKLISSHHTTPMPKTAGLVADVAAKATNKAVDAVVDTGMDYIAKAPVQGDRRAFLAALLATAATSKNSQDSIKGSLAGGGKVTEAIASPEATLLKSLLKDKVRAASPVQTARPSFRRSARVSPSVARNIAAATLGTGLASGATATAIALLSGDRNKKPTTPSTPSTPTTTGTAAIGPGMFKKSMSPILAQFGFGVSQPTLSEKTASTALVRAIQRGGLSPQTISRAAAGMPEGKFRFLSHLGTGQFTAADKVVGNIGGVAGEMARKMPVRVSPNYMAEGTAMQKFVNKINSNAAKRFTYSQGGRAGADPVAPILGSTPHGVFQRLADQAPMRSSGSDHYLTRRIQDLHSGNFGPKGQILDAAPNIEKLAPGVPTNLDLMDRKIPLGVSYDTYKFINRPSQRALNAIRRLFDSRQGTYAENIERLGVH